MGRFPARLHVLLARDARIGVVIRRGPSKSVCTVLWNRRTDEFTLAQWMRGRIYERRSDVAPDGKHLIYFAMNGKWTSEARGSWTAISRAPYLKAVTLLAKGDCWHGGGLFTGNQQYWLNDGYGHTLVRDTGELDRDLSFTPRQYGGECPGVYYTRLQRDNWSLRDPRSTTRFHELHVFEKEIRSGWILRKLAHAETGAPPGHGCYWDEHEVENTDKGITLTFPDWEWADLDRGRLVWAAAGKLWAGHMRGNGVHPAKCLYDFNDMKFEPIAAPY